MIKLITVNVSREFLIRESPVPCNNDIFPDQTKLGWFEFYRDGKVFEYDADTDDWVPVWLFEE